MIEESSIPLWLVITVISIAVAVGILMIVVVLGKYAIHQWFHILGGPMLSTLGVVLIGLSVFGNVKLKAGEFEAELRRLYAHVESIKSSLATKDHLLANLSNELEKKQETVVQLQEELHLVRADLDSTTTSATQAEVQQLKFVIGELKQEVADRQETIGMLVKSANEIGVYAQRGKQALSDADKGGAWLGNASQEIAKGSESFQQITAEVDRINSLAMR